MQDINGRRLDKFYEISPNLFRLDFGKSSLVISLGACFFLTPSPPAAPEEPSAFAMQCRKHLNGEKLSSFSQYKADRIFTLSFSGGKSIVIEMFSGGNLFLLDENGEIVRPYHFKQTGKKNYKVGQKYEFPSAAPFHFPPGATEWSALSQDAQLSSSLPKWPIGKIYCLEALARAKISPERKPSDLSDAQIDLFLKSLSHMLKNPQPCVYAANGNLPGELSFAQLSTHQNENFRHGQFPSCNGAIAEFFSTSQENYEKLRNSKDPPELVKLKNRLATQGAALAQTEKEIALLEGQAKYVGENLALIEGRIEELNSGAGCPILGQNESLDLKRKKYTLKI